MTRRFTDRLRRRDLAIIIDRCHQVGLHHHAAVRDSLIGLSHLQGRRQNAFPESLASQVADCPD